LDLWRFGGFAVNIKENLRGNPALCVKITIIQAVFVITSILFDGQSGLIKQ
jgi:hypothetical protein